MEKTSPSKTANSKAVKWHAVLAEYFSIHPLFFDDENKKNTNKRKLVEQPWQQTKALMWDETTFTLSDLFFIEAKVQHGLIDDLYKDYSRAFMQMPDSKNKTRLNLYYTCFLLNIDFFRIYPDSFFQTMYNQLKWFALISSATLDSFKINFLNRGRSFLDQIRQPEKKLSHLIMSIKDGGAVKTCQVSFNGKTVASGNSRGEIKLWDINTGKLVKVLNGHAGWISDCSFLPADDRLLTSSYDSTLKLWDVVTGKETMMLNGHADSVLSCAISKDGLKIISASKDKTLKAWDVNTGSEIRTFTGHEKEVSACAFSPDGKYILSGDWGGQLILWDTESGESIFKTTNPDFKRIYSCDFSPCKNKVIAGRGDTLMAYKLTDNGRLEVLAKTKNQAVPNHSNINSLDINSCKYSHDGSFFVTGGVGGVLRIFDELTGKDISIFGFCDEIECCAWSPDGEKIVTAEFDGSIRVFDAKRPHASLSYKISEQFIKKAYWAPDNKWVAAVSNHRSQNKNQPDQLNIYNIQNGREQFNYSLAACRIQQLAWHPDSKKIVSEGKDGIVKQWNLDDGKPISTPQPRYTKTITVQPHCLSWSQDGNRLIFQNYDCSILICDKDDFGNHYQIDKGKNRVVFAGLAPDERYALIKTYEQLHIWDIEDGKKLPFTIKSDDWSRGAYSPDGKLIATRNGSNSIVLSSSRNGEPIVLKSGLSKNIYGFSWLPTGKRLLLDTGDDLQFVGIQQSEQDELFFGDKVNSDSLLNYSIAPGGELIAVSHDETLMLINLKSGENTGIFKAETRILNYCFSFDGTKISVSDNLGNFYILKLTGYKTHLPVVTPARLWRYENASALINPQTNMEKGRWDEMLTVKCSHCGKRIPVDNPILDIIESNYVNAGVAPDDSPCLKLPDEAWDEPGLLSQCPKCHKPLKFNPFVVDNRGLYE